MKRNNFEINSIILFVLMMGANVCNYIFQIVMGNMLEVEAYGMLNTIMSMFTIFLIPNVIIAMVSARYASMYSATEEYGKLRGIIKFLGQISIVISLIILLIGVVGKNAVASIFQIQDKRYILYIAVISIIILGSSIFNGILQGTQQFFKYGVQNILNIICKLVFSIIFVTIGFNIGGVLGALLIGSIVMLSYSVFNTRNYWNIKENVQQEDKVNYKEILSFITGTVGAQIVINCIANGDILLVKAFFSEHEAGLYSSVMVLGKISLYVSGAIVATLFPMVAELKARKEDTRPLLKKAIIYGGGMSVACSAGLIICGKLIVQILFGDRYMEAVEYMPSVCAFVVPLTLLTIIMNYILALGKTRILSISMILGTIILVFVTKLFHSTISQMFGIVGSVLSIMVIINLIYIAKIKGGKCS